MEVAITADRVGKRFVRYPDERPTTFKEAFVHGVRALKPVAYFWALRDVSFTLARGQMLGVIGPNGSGKSTLLRLLGGVMRPDEGHIDIRGHIGGLLQLGSGFHPDLTGQENVLINGVVAGLTRGEIARRFDDIIAFAGLEDFMNSPLRTYSTGMKMRLGFSIAIHTDPEVLLIDEVLTVGDLAFQQKCLARIQEMKANGSAIVLVSHSLSEVSQLCEEVLWLREGRGAAYGDAEVVVGQYQAEMLSETRRRTPASLPARPTSAGTTLRVHENRFGSLEMEIEKVRLLGADASPVTEIAGGSGLTVAIHYHAPDPIEAPIFSVAISNAEHQTCFDANTDAERVSLAQLHGRGCLYLHLDRLDLSAGRYYVDVGVYEQRWAYAYDYHWHVYPLRVHDDKKSAGILAPPRRWELEVETYANADPQAGR